MCKQIVVLVMGNIGTGKTFFISKLNQRVNRAFIQCDEYNSHIDFIKDITNALALNKTLILEGNYTSRALRKEGLINSIKRYFPKCEFICFDFGPGNSETLENRLSVTDELKKNDVVRVHYQYQKEYLIPITSEGFNKIIHKWKFMNKS
jgi:hypothetical protein